MRYLYVMVSRTDTGFARLIRRFTGCYYNHAAISFDCDCGSSIPLPGVPMTCR